METEECFEDNSSDEENSALGEAKRIADEKRLEQRQKTVIEQERNAEKADHEQKMAPLMLFLSSSLNTELVYTILYGMTKFALLNSVHNKFTKD